MKGCWVFGGFHPREGGLTSGLCSAKAGMFTPAATHTHVVWADIRSLTCAAVDRGQVLRAHAGSWHTAALRGISVLNGLVSKLTATYCDQTYHCARAVTLAIDLNHGPLYVSMEYGIYLPSLFGVPARKQINTPMHVRAFFMDRIIPVLELWRGLKLHGPKPKPLILSPKP